MKLYSPEKKTCLTRHAKAAKHSSRKRRERLYRRQRQELELEGRLIHG